MKKILSFFAAMLCAVAVFADPVVLPATLDVSNVSFRSEGMPDFVLEEGDYAGTYFDMGAHDSSNDTLLYAEWNVTIQPLKYNIIVGVYNENSWSVRFHVLNQANEEVKTMYYKGHSGEKGKYAAGTIDMRDLAAGDYKIRVHAATAWSKLKVKEVIMEADYQGVTVALPGTLLPAYAELSANASVTDGAIAFKPSTAPDEYANWNVSFAKAGSYNVKIDITASNGHNYGVELIAEDEETIIGAVNEGGQVSDTGEKELGAIEVPAAGNYIVHLTNAIKWSEAVLNSITFAAPAPAHTYTVAGSSTDLFGEAWKPALEANDMELQNDGTYKWEKSELTLAAGAIEFKVCEDHAWTKCWPSQNYELNIAESGIYTITITFEPDNNNKVSAVATKTGSADVLPTVAMHGNFLGSWADTENFTVADDQKTASLKLTIAAGNYEFGMRIGGSGNWTSNGVAFSRENNSAKIVAGQGNLTLAADAAGDYIFTWTYETETLAITFPEAPALDAPAAAPADPTLEAYQVKAVYSAKYSADCNFGEWSSGTAYTQEEFGKKYVTAASGYFGLEFAHTDCSEMEALHLDAWIAADASIRVVPIHGGTEVGVTVELKGQKWNSIDIALSKFEGVTNWSNVYQIKIDNAANLTFWLNNVYFYTTQEKTVDLVDGYYLIGTMNGWDIHNLKATDKFAVNPENDKEYVLTTALAENDEFKVVAVANNALGAWYPGEGENYKVDFAHAGDSKDIYFRPDYQGGEGWYANCIYVAENVNTNPYEAWFATGDTWNTETESYLEWNEDAKKATVYIKVDKYGQWRAQVKYHGPIAEAGKYYRVALKMKSNNALQNVTIKYQDNAEMIYVADAALEAGVEFAFDQKAAGVAGGNGIMVLDFGFAKAGDIIEIYDVVIEETEAPEQVLADGYYLIGTIGGVSGWTVADVKAENKFEQNPENNVEYMLNVTLAEGDELQVVNVINDQISGDWFPGGEGNNYIVDADHAGEVTIYFRPDREGGDDWWKGCIYVDAKDEPVADCDWDNIAWIGDGSPEQTFGSQFKVCVGNPAPTSIVNIQKPGWAAESGIYMSFPSAAFGEISLPEGKYAIDGAGMVLYVSAFVNKLTDVTIVCDGNTYALTVYNDKGKDASAIESNTIAPKAVKLIENGQLYIILNGVRYNALGQME